VSEPRKPLTADEAKLLISLLGRLETQTEQTGQPVTVEYAIWMGVCAANEFVGASLLTLFPEMREQEEAETLKHGGEAGRMVPYSLPREEGQKPNRAEGVVALSGQEGVLIPLWNGAAFIHTGKKPAGCMLTAWVER